MSNGTETNGFTISGGGLLGRIVPKNSTVLRILAVGAVLVAWLPVLVL